MQKLSIDYELISKAISEFEKPQVIDIIDEYENVKILRIKDSLIPLYKLSEHELTTREKEIKDRIVEGVKERILKYVDRSDLTMEGKEEIKNKIMGMLRPFKLHVDVKRLIAEKIVQETVGYGIIDPLLSDANLEEVMISGIELPVFVVHRKYGTCITNVRFRNKEELMGFISHISTIIGKEVNYMNPILDGRLPDKKRINIVIPPVALDGPLVTIRQFLSEPMSIVDLIKNKTFSVELAAFLWLCIDGVNIKPSNLLIVGGAASGKTTTLNSLLSFIPETERIITIEDTEELLPLHKNRARMETHLMGKKRPIDMDLLAKCALRMRPDRIIIGEVRGSEAKSLFIAMNTGHDGSMGTIHANSAEDAITRLLSPPMEVPESLLSVLDLIIVQKRFFNVKEGIYRRIAEVCELSMENGKVKLDRIFKWDSKNDNIVFFMEKSKLFKNYADIINSSGIDFKELMERRLRVIKQLVDMNAGSRRVYKAIREERLRLYSKYR